MNRPEFSFSVTVDAAQGMCPSGERWAETQIREGKIPVLACEGPCIRGDIARLVANLVAKEEPYARACYAEVALVPKSGMARWAQLAEKIVMIDGCFLKCVGRILRNLVDDSKIVHIEALPYYMKYTDVFLMDDVPETERKETARQVADRILEELSRTLPAQGKAFVEPGSRSCGQMSSTAPSDNCPEKGGNPHQTQRPAAAVRILRHDAFDR